MWWPSNDDLKKRIFNFSFLGSLVGFFLALYGFVEAAGFCKVIVIEERNISFLIGLIVTALVLNLFHSVVLIYKIKNSSLEEKILEVKENFARLNASTKKIISERNYYKLIFLSWILKSDYEKSHVKDITGEENKIYSITVQQPLNYIISITHGIINRLSSSDVFMTVSNIDFWGHITEDKTFLEANITAARENSVLIDRIVLLDRRILQLPNLNEKKETLRKTIAALRDFYDRHKEAFTNNLRWQFYVSDNYEVDNENPVPYAIIMNTSNTDCMFMHPIIATAGALQMNLRFGRKRSDIDIASSWVKFDNLKSQTLYSIDQIYNKMFDKNGEWNIE